MSLKIVNVFNSSEAEKEHIILRATKDINIYWYAVVDRTLDEDNDVTNIFRHVFRFPNKEIKENEYISLWTGKGIDCEAIYKNEQIHRFYWGADSPIWNDKGGDRAEVWSVSRVASKNVTR